MNKPLKQIAWKCFSPGAHERETMVCAPGYRMPTIEEIDMLRSLGLPSAKYAIDGDKFYDGSCLYLRSCACSRFTGNHSHAGYLIEIPITLHVSAATCSGM